MAWLKDDLILGWPAAEDHPALAEVHLQIHESSSEPLEIVRQFLIP